MCWAGWERLVNWQTFLAADVNALSQNMLNMMLRTKILTPWTMWELICLDEGGPQLADPEVKIITPEVEIPQSWSKKNPTKVRGGAGCLCCQTLEAILAKWLVHGPTDHKGTFQAFYRQTVTSGWVYGGQMSFSKPMRQKGVSETKRGIFWYHCSFPLPDWLWFELWWITLYESLWSSSIWKLPEVYLDCDVRAGKITLDPAVCSFKVRSSELWNRAQTHIRKTLCLL